MRKLTFKEVSLFKLAVWTCLVVWMVFYFALSLVFAGKLSGVVLDSLGSSGLWGPVMAWVAPIWLVFTVILTIAIIARWAKRKLG